MLQAVETDEVAASALRARDRRIAIVPVRIATSSCAARPKITAGSTSSGEGPLPIGPDLGEDKTMGSNPKAPEQPASQPAATQARAPNSAATFERVCGGMSMVPTIYPGDPVYLAPRRDLRSGDVVVFSGEGDYDIVHRFIFKLPFAPYFVHRGDAVGAQVSLGRWDRIVGVAELPRRRPTSGEVVAGAWLVVQQAARRLIG